MEPWSKMHGLPWTVHSLPLVRINLLAWHSTRAPNVSMVGPNSAISWPKWLAFYDSELCSMCCADELGLEFNWKGALYPVLWYCRGIMVAGMLSSDFLVFFFASSGSQSRIQCVAFLFLRRGNSKSDNSLKRLQIALKSKMTIENLRQQGTEVIYQNFN